MSNVCCAAEQQLEGRLAGIHDFDLIALGFEVEAQALGEVLLVFDYQDPVHLAPAHSVCDHWELQELDHERAALAGTRRFRPMRGRRVSSPPSARCRVRGRCLSRASRWARGCGRSV